MFKKKGNLASSKEFKELIEQSEDLNSDSIAQTKQALNELTELAKEKKISQENNKGTTVLKVVGATAAVASIGAVSKMANAFGASEDVSILQTAASIEVLAVNTYGQALNLPFIGGAQANQVVSTFVTTTRKQHQQHLQAFNAALTNMGHSPQNNPDPVLLKVVNSALPSLTDPLSVVKLAITLENTAAESYVQYVALLSDLNSKKIMASIMGVEAQHVAILNAVEALLEANAASLIALPPKLNQLPAAAGSVGFPNSFYQTNLARPVTEGALS